MRIHIEKMRRGAAVVVTLGLAACRPQGAVTLGDASEISAPTALGAAPILALSASGQRAAAWVSAPDGGDQGRLNVVVGDSGVSSVIVDSLGPIEPHGEAPPKLVWSRDGSLGALYAVGKMVPGRRFPASALRFTRSTDGGRSWSSTTTVADSSTFGSYNFHALHAGADGRLYAAWLDGRHGKSAAYIAASADGGVTWSRNVRVSLGEACPCCRTALASGVDGTLYMAWRAVLPGSIRDVVVARSTDGGASWSEPVRVHNDDWVYDGCPHAGPSMQVDARGTLHVIWWTGKAGRAGVHYANSRNGGQSFTTPIPVGTAATSRPSHAQLALGNDDTIVAAWDDGTTKLPQIVMRVSRDAGTTFGAPMPISGDSVSAQFPVLGVHGRSVTVLWAEQTAATAAHDAAHRPNMRDPAMQMPLPKVGATRVLQRTGTVN